MNTHYRRVVLTGFMGAGKTTVGRLLAPLLGWQFIDADDALCQQTGHSIAELFSLHGEKGFRALEAQTVAALAQCEQAVVALGGGALEHPETLRLLTLQTDGLLVYLENSLELSLSRCTAEPGAAVRPVLGDREALAARFASRQPLYRQAHLIVTTGECDPAEIARRIAEALARG